MIRRATRNSAFEALTVGALCRQDSRSLRASGLPCDAVDGRKMAVRWVCLTRFRMSPTAAGDFLDPQRRNGPICSWQSSSLNFRPMDMVRSIGSPVESAKYQ
jgi:hypothetical protein